MNKQIQNKFESIEYSDLIDVVYFINKSFQNNLSYENLRTFINQSVNENNQDILEELFDDYRNLGVTDSSLLIVELYQYFSKRTRESIKYDSTEAKLLLTKLKQRVWNNI